METRGYKHGTYGEYVPSIGTIPATSGTVAVYVGTAPVNLVKGYKEKDLINRPVKVSNLTEAKIGKASL